MPQGSVLGPLLFLIYTNDIVNNLTNNAKIWLFADDTNVFLSTNSPFELKQLMTEVLKDLFQWFSANILTINLDKTCYTISKCRNKQIPEYLNSIQIENAIVKKVLSTKYLGVILDENLDWKEHMSNINNSLIKTSNSFKIIKHQVSQLDKIIFYYDYIYSKIQYGIEVYGKASITALRKVQTQQNRAIKILFNKDFLTPTHSLHKDIDILLVQDIFKLYILKFVDKQQKQLLPNIFNNFYITSKETHNYNTRQRGNLHVNKITKNKLKIYNKTHGKNILVPTTNTNNKS